jgi:hypothetical protein
LPSSKLLNFDYQQAFIFPCNIWEGPIPQAFVIFTDASGSANTAYFSSHGQKVVQTGFSIVQCAEPQTLILACQDFVHILFNLYTDSAYVCDVVKLLLPLCRIHQQEQLFHLFLSRMSL